MVGCNPTEGALDVQRKIRSVVFTVLKERNSVMPLGASRARRHEKSCKDLGAGEN